MEKLTIGRVLNVLRLAALGNVEPEKLKKEVFLESKTITYLYKLDEKIHLYVKMDLREKEVLLFDVVLQNEWHAISPFTRFGTINSINEEEAINWDYVGPWCEMVKEKINLLFEKSKHKKEEEEKEKKLIVEHFKEHFKAQIPSESPHSLESVNVKARLDIAVSERVASYDEKNHCYNYDVFIIELNPKNQKEISFIELRDKTHHLVIYNGQEITEHSYFNQIFKAHLGSMATIIGEKRKERELESVLYFTRKYRLKSL